MTSPSESVEVIEATWNIPNFLAQTSTSVDRQETDFHKTFSIKGRVPTLLTTAQHGMSTLPVKLEASLQWFDHFEGDFRTYDVLFRVSDSSQLPPSSVLRGKLLNIKVVWYDRTFYGFRSNLKKPFDFLERNNVHAAMRIWESDIRSHMNKGDGSLKIYFKIEITHNLWMPTTINEGVAVLNDLETLLKDSRNADVEIRVSQGRGQTFRCHKLILAARSEIFRAMFESDMKEAEDKVVEMDDILPKTMEHFLHFLYCGRFQDSSWVQSLPQLAYASDKYCIESLKNLCDLHLIRSVTSRNALALGKLAKRHGLKKAAKDIRDFMTKNNEEVTAGPEVDCSDVNFKLRYSVANCSDKTAKKGPKSVLPKTT